MGSCVTTVSIVTAFDAAQVPHGLTCTSLTSVTLDPPILLVCLNNTAGTLKAVSETRQFAVNILGSSGAEVARSFSSNSPDRFGAVTWEPSPTTGQPWLTACAIAMAECELEFTSNVGTHVVVFGRVTSLRVEGDLPLLYGRRSFRSAGAVISQ
ncbi:flavin reductase family protein [Nocardia camponoti]|uniref:flavin reductase family protein n=1 Tax=Nocardia camponoti TaxID=1616106 RepID=UPI00357155D0